MHNEEEELYETPVKGIFIKFKVDVEKSKLKHLKKRLNEIQKSKR